MGNKSYYYQTRNGKRVRVRHKRNSLRVHKGKSVTRVSARGAIPVSSGELYGKAVVVNGSKSNSIKSDSGIAIRRHGNSLSIRGRAGNLKGGAVVGHKRGRAVDAVASYGKGLSYVANFAAYYTRTRNGKQERVKKKRKSRPSYVARLLGKNSEMYRSPKYNQALAVEVAREIERGKDKPKTFGEKFIGKRYRNAEARVYRRFKKNSR